jgi:hypothetical protein
MKILIIIALTIIGLLLGFWFWQISEKFSVGAWEKLPAPPNKIVELIPASDPPLYIKISDGTTYRYEEWQNRGWIEEVVPQTSMNPTEVQRPCDLSAPEFSRWSNHPHDIVDCVQETVMYADGFIRYTFALDEHGYLWQSRITRTAYGSLTTLLCYPGLGLLFGLVAGVFVAIRRPGVGRLSNCVQS